MEQQTITRVNINSPPSSSNIDDGALIRRSIHEYTKEQREAYREYVRTSLAFSESKITNDMTSLLEKYGNTYVGINKAVYLHYKCVMCKRMIVGSSLFKCHDGIKYYEYDNKGNEPLTCIKCEEISYCSDSCRKSDKVHICYQDHRNTGHVCKLYH